MSAGFKDKLILYCLRIVGSLNKASLINAAKIDNANSWIPMTTTVQKPRKVHDLQSLPLGQYLNECPNGYQSTSIINLAF